MRPFALALMLVFAGCGTYNYNRAALVPRATPRMTNGQPLTGKGQVSLGASSVANLIEPGVGDPDAGIEIPGTQLHGDLRGRISDLLSFGILYENGLEQGAVPLKRTQPPVNGGSVQGYGVAIDVSIPTGNPKLHVGLGVDAMVWSVPYVQYFTCAAGDTCFPYMIEDRGHDLVDSFAASITPSYRVADDVTLFGGVTVRQHPTIQQKGMELDPLFQEPEVESGPPNFIVSGGAEISFADGGILASAMAYYDVSQTPAKYGPGLALMVTLPFGKVKPTPPVTVLVPVAPQGYPPPGYPQPGYPAQPVYPAQPPYPAPPPGPVPLPYPAPTPPQ
ncbi:MAG: hypothetical protein H6Q90_298 [Deltaproteobacteria bacterium]|nr:hypothetical protein [Deltaproteobacteria bacterium]